MARVAEALEVRRARASGLPLARRRSVGVRLRCLLGGGAALRARAAGGSLRRAARRRVRAGPTASAAGPVRVDRARVGGRGGRTLRQKRLPPSARLPLATPRSRARWSAGSSPGCGAGRGETLAIEPGADLDLVLQRAFEGLSRTGQTVVLATALAGEDEPAVSGLDEGEATRARVEARSAGWLSVGPDGRHPAPQRCPPAGRSGRGTRTRLPAGRRPSAAGARPRRSPARRCARRRRCLCRSLDGVGGEGGTGRRRGDPARAALALERARDLLPDRPWPLPLRLTAVTGLGLLGRYDEAARQSRRRVRKPGAPPSSRPVSIAKPGCERAGAIWRGRERCSSAALPPKARTVRRRSRCALGWAACS